MPAAHFSFQPAKESGSKFRNRLMSWDGSFVTRNKIELDLPAWNGIWNHTVIWNGKLELWDGKLKSGTVNWNSEMVNWTSATVNWNSATVNWNSKTVNWNFATVNWNSGTVNWNSDGKIESWDCMAYGDGIKTCEIEALSVTTWPSHPG